MLNIPNDEDFLSFFESEPIESKTNDGFFCFKYSDENDMCLWFSYDIFQSSIQVKLSLKEQEFITVVQENAKKIQIGKDNKGEYLECIFDSEKNIKTKAIIRVSPNIIIDWFNLS